MESRHRTYEIQTVLLAALLSAVVTGAGAWLSFGRGTVGRGEMQAYVATYVSARIQPIAQNTAAVAKLTDSIDQFQRTQSAANANFRTMIEVLKERVGMRAFRQKDDQQ